VTIFVSGGTVTGQVYDYPTLVQAIQDYWARSDLVSNVGYLIQGAEDAIYSDIFELNEGRGTPDFESPLTLTITNGTAPVPSDYLALRNAQVLNGGNAYPIQRKNVEFIYTNYPQQSASGIPAFMARQGNSFIFGPYPDAAYGIQGSYWARAATLTGSNPTNWMTDQIPTILLTACHVEAAKFLKDADAGSIWNGIYQQRLTSYIKRSKAEAWSGSALAMSPA
jgi:hypothetical protein